MNLFRWLFYLARPRDSAKPARVDYFELGKALARAERDETRKDKAA